VCRQSNCWGGEARFRHPLRARPARKHRLHAPQRFAGDRQSRIAAQPIQRWRSFFPQIAAPLGRAHKSLCWKHASPSMQSVCLQSEKSPDRGLLFFVGYTNCNGSCDVFGQGAFLVVVNHSGGGVFRIGNLMNKMGIMRLISFISVFYYCQNIVVIMKTLS
jgi:hypothetical protein